MTNNTLNLNLNLNQQHKMLHFHLQFRTPILQVQLAAAPRHFIPIRCSISAADSNPARDSVIDFGKYRGKMLGTLPSPYLQWISKNLRAGDTEHWARLADQVLEDPVYKDRVEWEFAEKVLNGDVLMKVPTFDSASSVEALLQISERFGWDNEDKFGWSKVKFELLGTSRGGRIPRITDKGSGGGGSAGAGGSSRKSVVCSTMKRRSVTENVERERRREERRVRRVKDNVGNETAGGGGENSESFARTASEIHNNRFPGRESLLRKAMLIGRRDGNFE